MTTKFLYDETIVFSGGKIKAQINLEYGEGNKVFSEQSYSDVIKAAKALKLAINKIAKEYKK